MKHILDRLHALPLRIHRAISFLSMLGSSVLGWVLTEIFPGIYFVHVICLVGFIGGIVWHIVFVRCPHCGHLFNYRAAIPNFCPECGKKLE